MDNQTLKEKYLSFEGRLNRKRFILRQLMLWLLALIIVLPVAIILSPWSESFRYFSTFINIIFIAPLASLTIRRLHDLNKPAWWIISMFIPFLNIFPCIYVTFVKGTTGSNKYGQDPLETI